MDVIEAREFRAWLEALKDDKGRAAIVRRVDRLRRGLLGDIKPVGESVSELRVDVGPGYRIYTTQVGRLIIVLICGGDKSSQNRDIVSAKRLAGRWKKNE